MYTGFVKDVQVEHGTTHEVNVYVHLRPQDVSPYTRQVSGKRENYTSALCL